MKDIVCSVCVFLCLTGVSRVQGMCADPQSLPSYATRLSPTEVSYAANDPIVFACNQDVGWGYVEIRCQDNDKWGNPDRACEDQSDIEGGFIAGLVVFLITVIITVVFIILAVRLGKKNEKVADEKEAKAEQNGGTSQK